MPNIVGHRERDNRGAPRFNFLLDCGGDAVLDVFKDVGGQARRSDHMTEAWLKGVGVDPRSRRELSDLFHPLNSGSIHEVHDRSMESLSAIEVDTVKRIRRRTYKSCVVLLAGKLKISLSRPMLRLLESSGDAENRRLLRWGRLRG